VRRTLVGEFGRPGTVSRQVQRLDAVELGLPVGEIGGIVPVSLPARVVAVPHGKFRLGAVEQLAEQDLR
jgi:hypothetical protein